MLQLQFLSRHMKYPARTVLAEISLSDRIQISGKVIFTQTSLLNDKPYLNRNRNVEVNRFQYNQCLVGDTLCLPFF